jgi:hypothetical protein
MESSIKEESPCWKGYQQIGMKEKGGKQVPNCVPEGKVNEANDKLMKVGSTMMMGGNNLMKPVKMKLVSIDYLPKDKKYSYKFQGGGRTQYFTDDVLANKLKSEVVKENVLKEDLNALGLLIPALGALVGGGLAQLYPYFTGSPNIYTNIKDWWKSKKDNSEMNKIANRIKNDPEVQEFLKKKNKSGWQKMLKKKLTGSELNYLNKIYRSRFNNESVNEAVSPKDMDKIKAAVEAAKSFMSVGAELKKLGMKYTFATEPLAIYIIQPTPNNKVAIVNKRYASKPDFVVGDIAVGIMEGILKEDYDGPVVIKTGDKNTFKVGEKVTFDDKGKKREYKVVHSKGNGDFTLKLVESVNEAASIYKDWDEFVNPHYILVTLKNGKKLKIEKKNVKGGTNVYHTILKAFNDDNYEITNKVVSGMLDRLGESVNEASPCWKGYKQVGMKNKNGREVPNCVPESVMNEASVAKLHKDLAKVVDAIENELTKYKSNKGTDKAKQNVENLKKLNITKKKIEAEMDKTISSLYKDAELEEGCGCK